MLRLSHPAVPLLCAALLLGCDGGEIDPSSDAGAPLADAALPFDDAGPGRDASTAPDAADGGADAPALRVLRDERGVPHIVAESLEAAMFATGYVHAEDRLFQMQHRRLRMQGRLAEFFARTDPTGDELDFNARLLRSDRRYRTLGMAPAAARTVEALSPAHRALLEAYAAGVNAQLAERASLGTAFDEFGIDEIDPWTAGDAMLNWDAVGEIFGSSFASANAEVSLRDACADGTCPAVGCAGTVVDEDAAIVPPPADGMWPPTANVFASLPPGTASLLPGTDLRPPVDVKASQGFVVAGEHLAGGRPLIFGEPQIFLEAPSTWYETHVVVASEGIDVRGVGFAGSPGMLLFYGRHAAQTITAGGGDVADLFALTETADGSGYVVDGTPEAYARREETLLVRGGSAETLTVRESRYGPVVSHLLDDAEEAEETPLALRHANTLRPDSHSVIAGIELMRAHSLESYRDALRHWVSPPVNALYAGVDEDDGESHIAYHALTVIPRRAPLAVGATDVTGRHPYDGSDSGQDWMGQYDLDWNPHVIDPPSGYLFSGNHMPVGTWYDAFLYSGIRGNGDTIRSFELRTRLERLIDAPGDVDPEALHALHVDAGSESARRIRRALELLAERGDIPADDPARVPREPDEAAARVLTGLQQWETLGGGDLDQRVPGDFVVRALLGRMITAARAPAFACTWGGAEGGMTHFLREFGEDESVLGEAETAVLLATSRQALIDVAEEHGIDVASWASSPPVVVPYTVPYMRNFDCLRPGEGARCSAAPIHDVTALVPEDYVHTIASAAGSSWPFTVDFADVDGARALLAPGVSEEPTSPRYADQLPWIESKGRGEVDSLPPAPLDLARITVSEERTLSFPSE